MAITLGSNIGSTKVQRSLGDATRAVSTTFERLSSGQRINRASDDAAGLAIASSLNLKSRVLSQGLRNANDGISVLGIADSALGQLSDILASMQELATQSANGSLSSSQRQSINKQSQALTAEYNRIIESTTFNGTGLINGQTGTLNFQLGFGSSGSIGVRTSNGLSSTRGNLNFTELGDQGGGGSSIYGITASGDFNNDGFADYVNSDSSNTISIWINNGDGTFASAPYGSGNGTEARAIAVLDYNGDGNLDIATLENNGATLQIYSGDGTGAFSFDMVALGGAYSTLAVGDTNGDGKSDILVGVNGTVRTYNGNSNAALTLSSSFSLGSTGATFLSTADVNGDGKQDIVAQVGGSLVSGLGNGSGGFGSFRTTTGITEFGDMLTGDFNNDGIPDVLVTDSYYFTSGNRLGLYLGNSDGSYSKSATFTGFSTLNGANIADINGDGNLDFVTSEYGNTLTTFFGKGDGTFTSKRDVLNSIASWGANGISRPLLADFNNDGVLDLGGIGMGSYLGILQQGTTTTNNIQSFTLGSQSGARAALDYLSTLSSNLQTARSSLGAGISRISAATGVLQSALDGSVAARGRIMDADIAGDSALLVRNQIMQNAAISVLAQANQAPALAVMLLRN
jgi:flagellin